MPEQQFTTTLSDAELPGLLEMLDELREAPEIVRPSAFWEYHAALQYQELEQEGGFREFKRNVNRHFFQFRVSDPRDPQFRAALGHWLRHPSGSPAVARLSEPLAPDPGSSRLAAVRRALGSRVYARYVALMWEYARQRGGRWQLDQLSEPQLGHPISVRYRDRLLSEDLCNSILEFLAIDEGTSAAPRTVIELGGGYGRLAWLFLRLMPEVRYVLVDIPPGLALAQRYLSELFPERRIFSFRRFSSHEEVASELAAAQIVFLTPNQLEYLPPLDADLFVNVSSLHEMSREQIEHYFKLVGIHCVGCFYSKQWLRSINPFDELVIERHEYPVPSEWRVMFDRRHPIQTKFFEALYQLPPGARENARR